MQQGDLFEAILSTYTEAGSAISNDALYASISDKLGLSNEVCTSKTTVGTSTFNTFKRKVRWYQQTLKQLGVLERITGSRGHWCMPKKKEDDLDKVMPNLSVIGFNTELGVAIIGYSEHVFARIDEPVHLILTSPPYPLTSPRKYGNVKESEYVDWICKTIEPVIKNLVDGGSICLNISNDIFNHGMPSRSLYKERLVLALHDSFGLHKMDELVWHNASKPPGPYQWASRMRVQLNVAWEPVIWMTNNPNRVLSDNRRVLQPHSEQHLKFMLAGGSKKAAVKSDGAYRLKNGSYGNVTEGKIPRNVIEIGTNCCKNRMYKKNAEAQGFTPHGAMFPSRLAAFLIEFLTDKGQLVVDSFAGSLTVGREAERLERRWICVEPVVDYVLGGALRFNVD